MHHHLYIISLVRLGEKVFRCHAITEEVLDILKKYWFSDQCPMHIRIPGLKQHLLHKKDGGGSGEGVRRRHFHKPINDAYLS